MVNDLIIWVSELPIVILYAVIGAIFGAFGGLFAFVLSHIFPKSNLHRVIPIVFILASVQITRIIALPQIDQMAFKAAFMKAQGELPRKVDEITIYESAGVYNGTLNYNYRITVDIDDKDDVRATIFENLASSELCRRLTSIPSKYASAAIFRYETNLGEIVISPKSGDCR